MEHRDLLTDVSSFLREILAKENLSEHAEICRKQLLQKLDFRETSPQAYLDMNMGVKGETTLQNKEVLDPSECYEVLCDANAAKDKEAIETQIMPDNSYYNVPTLLQQNSSASNESKPEILNTINNKSSLHSSLHSSFKNSNTNTVKSVKKNSPDRISQSSSITCSSSSKSDVGEVLSTSASALRYSAVKYGALSRKEKSFFMEHLKQYWAALLGHTLYLYNNEKDSKPMLEVDITGYQARPVGLRESNKKDFSFEVIKPGNKTHQFTAESTSEMELWIAAICQAGKIIEFDGTSDTELSLTRGTVRQLPSIPLAQILYDHPDSNVRPVNPPQQEVYELMQEPVEDLYYYIEHQPKNENVSTGNEIAMYNNINGTEENDNMYYNLIPCPDNDECIYDVIPEKKKEIPKEIKEMSQRIETSKTDSPQKNSKPKGLIVQDEIYELVN